MIIRKLTCALMLAFLALNLQNTIKAQESSLDKESEKSIIQRLQYLEEEARRLNGKIEELEHKNYILEKQLMETKEGRYSTITANSINSKEMNTTDKEPLDANAANEENENVLDRDENIDSKKKRYEHAKELLNATKYDYALKAFEDFAIDYPDDKLTITAYFWIGEIYLLRSELEKAAIAYGKSYGKYKELLAKKTIKKDEYMKAPDSLVKLALTFKNMKKFEDAKVTLTQFEKEFKKAPITLKKRAEIIKRQIKIVTG